MNYRKKYEKLTGLPVPKGFEVHHIDFDKTNNEITNLVALPKELHTEYHKLKYTVDNGLIRFQTSIPRTFYSSNLNNLYIQEFKAFHECISECFEWVYYRDFLLNLLPFEPEKSYFNVGGNDE